MGNEFPFYKYSGCGNDFVLVEECHVDTAELVATVPALCHRSEGIGADGVLLLIKREGVDRYLRIFNADGSEAELCGNGLRCVVRCLRDDLGIASTSYTLKTDSGLYSARIVDDSAVEVDLGASSRIESLKIKEFHTPTDAYALYALTVGVPHLVVLCRNVADIDVSTWGRLLRRHPRFSPEGTNVNFAVVTDDGNVTIRTYERGVEGETLACGSGAAATAIAAVHHWNLTPPLCILTRHGGALHYSFTLDGCRAYHLTMRGPARRCFRGTYTLG